MTKNSRKVPLILLWAITASITVMFLLLRPAHSFSHLKQNPERALNNFKEAAEDSTTWKFESSMAEPEFGSPSGDVTWSDQRQKGFLRLSGIFANDPVESQFQLWFIAPQRGSLPISGGVFDIRYEDLQDGEKAIIPIKAYNPVSDASGIAITKEKPGGVVISDLKRIVAVATRPST